MAITKFVPTLWEAAVQLPYDEGLIYGQPAVANRKYEGTISQQGDTVKVTTIAAPTIRTYDKTADLVDEDVTDGEIILEVDQGDYFQFRINDVDKVQAAGDFQGPATRQAGQGLARVVDTYLGTVLRDQVLAGNKFGDATVVDADPEKATSGQTSAYQVLVKLREKLDKKSVPTVGRFVVVNPEFISALLMDKRYTDLSSSGSTEGLLNGQVGRASGFNVLVSGNAPKVGGAGANKDYPVIIAGTPDALTAVNQINTVEAMRDPKRFADKVRGLNIYGGKLFRPEGIATANVNIVAPS
ncbi:P22 phage major capsid protein family protein [Rhodococcus opacus]|uniref:P22 phage major capsid protein family protein n=1 Tax=Rhodococcus opacus TaxID=37919 RepID=UPI001C4961CE|nr:P22 phage major capsid protein family protein [Rhodococcus opacus]MBV6758360.1 hypothetical protein [Rhodococcus opacus]